MPPTKPGLLKTDKIKLAALAAGALVVLALIVYAATRHAGSGDANAAPVATPTFESVGQLGTALVVGDSITVGTGSAVTGASYATIAVNRVGYAPIMDGQGATGFVANGRAGKAPDPTKGSYIERLPADKRIVPNPALVLVTGGRNDTGYPTATVTAAIHRYLTVAQETFPRARFVVVASIWNTGTPSANMLAIRDAERTEALRLGMSWIDPLAGHWITGDRDHPLSGNAAAMIGPDNVHPTAEGHDYLATLLETEMRALGFGKPIPKTILCGFGKYPPCRANEKH